MSGHYNTFNTAQIRPLSSIGSIANAIGIITPYPPSYYPIGLTQLDFSRERDIRVKCYIDNVKYVDSSGKFSATVHLDAWRDTILYSAACTWLPIPRPDREFQHGKVTLLNEQLVHNVSFDQEFGSTPEVIVWLNGIHVDSDAGWYIQVEATAVTTTGFIVKGRKWFDMIWYHVEVSWIAYPASRSNIKSGRFSTSEIGGRNGPQHTHSQAIIFDREFKRPPKVYFALSRIDSENSAHLRLKAYVTDATTRGMTVHIDSWVELNVNSAEGQWIAIQDL